MEEPFGHLMHLDSSLQSNDSNAIEPDRITSIQSFEIVSVYTALWEVCIPLMSKLPNTLRSTGCISILQPNCAPSHSPSHPIIQPDVSYITADPHHKSSFSYSLKQWRPAAHVQDQPHSSMSPITFPPLALSPIYPLV